MKTKNRIWLYQFLIIGLAFIFTNSCSKDEGNKNPSSITDKDGNVYTSVTIGSQVWMVENLKTGKLNDGTALVYAADITSWINLSTNPGYCWYNYDAATYKTPYGALYNWYAVGTGKLCPTGWHVPSDTEWLALESFLGGHAVAGAKLKETGTTHWLAPNTGATNESGFTGLPTGFRYDWGSIFQGFGSQGWWWSATQSSVWDLVSGNTELGASVLPEKAGASVRCLKD
jgi:uncharacterized protein (TIGR02145 family)